MNLKIAFLKNRDHVYQGKETSDRRQIHLKYKFANILNQNKNEP